MLKWPIDHIENHTDIALSRLTYQYVDSVNLKALVELWSDRTQILEDALQTLLKDRWISEAEGVQLDELGAMVGEPRLGRLDNEYRPAIRLKIQINLSGGQPETLINFIRLAFGAEIIVYNELWPAKIELFFQSTGAAIEQVEVDLETDDNELYEFDDESTWGVLVPDDAFFLAQFARLRDLIPAGVGAIYITETGLQTPFGTIEINGLNTDDFGGFGGVEIDYLEIDDGDAIELSSGDDLGVTPQDGQAIINYSDSGILSELFEVG